MRSDMTIDEFLKQEGFHKPTPLFEIELNGDEVKLLTFVEDTPGKKLSVEDVWKIKDLTLETLLSAIKLRAALGGI